MLNHLAVKNVRLGFLSHCVVTHLFLLCLQGEIGSKDFFVVAYVKLVRDGRSSQGPWLQQ